MRTSNISYLRKHLSEVLSCVKEGEPVLVLDRKKPVACLMPYVEKGEPLPYRLSELQSQGVIKHTPDERPAEFRPPLKPSKSVNVVQMLVEDRGEG